MRKKYELLSEFATVSVSNRGCFCCTKGKNDYKWFSSLAVSVRNGLHLTIKQDVIKKFDYKYNKIETGKLTAKQGLIRSALYVGFVVSTRNRLDISRLNKKYQKHVIC